MAEENETDQQAREREQALMRLEKRRALQSHLVAYLIVNVVFWALWAVTGAGYVWPVWITGLWAIVLALNAWDVYFRKPITDADIDGELERQRSHV